MEQWKEAEMLQEKGGMGASGTHALRDAVSILNFLICKVGIRMACKTQHGRGHGEGANIFLPAPPHSSTPSTCYSP